MCNAKTSQLIPFAIDTTAQMYRRLHALLNKMNLFCYTFLLFFCWFCQSNASYLCTSTYLKPKRYENTANQNTNSIEHNVANKDTKLIYYCDLMFYASFCLCGCASMSSCFSTYSTFLYPLVLFNFLPRGTLFPYAKIFRYVNENNQCSVLSWMTGWWKIFLGSRFIRLNCANEVTWK